MWQKILRVTWTEFSVAIRSKTFLIGLILLPVMMGGGIFVQHLTKDKKDTKDRRVAVVDKSGQIYSLLAEKATQRNERQVYKGQGEDRKKARPAYILEEVKSPEKDGEEQLILDLSKRVRKKELFAFVVLDQDILDHKNVEFSYYTQSPTYEDLPNWIERTVNEKVLSSRFEKAGLDRQQYYELSQRLSLKRLGLASQNKDTGEVIKAKERNPLATFGVPVISMFLMFIMVLTTATSLLNAVLEEKLQKIAEVLISSVTPFELMLGKLFGNLLVSLCLSGLYLSVASFLVIRFGMWGELISWSHLGWFLLFQILAFLSFGAICMAIGAACSEIRDAQNMLFPAMLLYMIPIFCWMPVLQAPTSAFARWISLFPTATPCLMLMRMFISPGPPWWEVFLGIFGTLAFMVLCVWVGGKVFRLGILFQGQTPSFPQLIKWIFSRD